MFAASIHNELSCRQILSFDCVLLLGVVIGTNTGVCAEPVPEDFEGRVGPATERRFPGLRLPEGFHATLFACDPLIEYPSVIANGPRPGTLFVAHDYMTGLGVDIVRRDEIRLIADTNGDGYADKSILYAKGFNSIQGLAFDGETVYAMHSPWLTSLRDANGDGVADIRRDLITGLGLPPEENPNRLHCANGVVVGHDGWLYLALGDRGCDVQRPEGDRLLFQQGGILRCRSDGRDLHVFATGLRNIYDVALDAELNVFVRDNENDGGDYMIRVCHCFHGSDHGYPYHYYERPAEAMPPLAELGRGSSAGGVCYLETAYPPEFHGNLFFCEWGRSVVRYQRTRVGESFAPVKEIAFAFGDDADPYGFKPTDLVVDRDGSLLVSDWADGQRPQRGRGRIYRVKYVGDKKEDPSGDQRSRPQDMQPVDWVAQLDSPSYHRRIEAQRAITQDGEIGWVALSHAMQRGKVGSLGRLHAIWVLAHLRQGDAIDELFEIAQRDADSRIRAQAIRAITDLTDPILAEHRLDDQPGDAKVARRLAALNVNSDPGVMLEVVIALGRLRWSGTPKWLHRHHTRELSAAILHAAQTAIRRSANWADTLAILDDPSATVRPAALRAVAEQHVPQIVEGLLDRLDEDPPLRRQEYADLLSQVYKKPEPWQYWGFRPAPRPANSVTWDWTEGIENGLAGLLADSDHDVRESILRCMLREEVPIPAASLAKWLEEETQPDRVAVILDALKNRPAGQLRGLLESIVRSMARTDENRLTALRMLVGGLDSANSGKLLEIAAAIEDGAVLAVLLDELGKLPEIDADQLLLSKLNSEIGGVRVAAIKSLAVRDYRDASNRVLMLLADNDVRVRRAAASAVGALQVSAATDRLLTLATDSDLATCRASLESLTRLQQPGAVDAAVAALRHPETQLAALAYLEAYGDPQQQTAVAKLADSNRSSQVLSGVVRTFSRWESQQSFPAVQNRLQREIAKIQGDAGALVRWTTLAPTDTENAAVLLKHVTQRNTQETIPLDPRDFEIRFANGGDGRVELPPAKQPFDEAVWLAVAHVAVTEETEVEFFATSDGTLQLWLNAQSAFERQEATSYGVDQDRFDATLPSGTSQLLVRVSGVQPTPSFYLRYRRKSSLAEHERLTNIVLSSQGNANRGRDVFLNAEKSQCIKCHRIADDGARVGPDLEGIGSRLSRIHLIESILEPSRTIAPSYGTVNVILFDGRVMTGVKLGENKQFLTIGDNQGTTHKVAKTDIEELSTQTRSTMPDGLEKQLTDDEFIDLISFLSSMTKTPAK